MYTSVPQIQTPGAGTFDPKADLLVGDSVEEYRSLPDYAIPLKWTRLTAHADITLKNLSLEAGETVQNIVLQGQNGAELTGDIIIDLCNSEEYATDGVPRVTVNAENLTVDASGNLEFWVSVFPVELTELTVTVTTDKATYWKVFRNIAKTFAQNARNILGISMQGATKTPLVPVATEYVLVDENLTDWTGDYLIVYVPGKVAFNGALTTLDASRNSIPVTISGKTIERSSQTDAARFTVTRSDNGYAIRSASILAGQAAKTGFLRVPPNWSTASLTVRPMGPRSPAAAEPGSDSTKTRIKNGSAIINPDRKLSSFSSSTAKRPAAVASCPPRLR